MTSDPIVRDLRAADASLRRFATHLVPGRADEALRRAYSSAITQRIPVLDGDRPSTRMLWEVRASSLALRSTPLAAAATDDALAAALHAIPANERAALILVGVEGRAVADVASVLSVTPERVVDLANRAASMLRNADPGLADADDAALVAAVRDLPVAPPAPPFWDSIEQEAAALRAAAGSDQRLTSPWVWGGVAAVAVVAIVGIALALSGGDDDETVAIDTSTTIDPAVTSTTVALAPSTTAPVEDTTTTTVAPTTTVATTTTAAPTTTEADAGPIDRGDVSFDSGAATLDGTLEGPPERWRLSVADGETLVLPSGVAGVEVLVLDGDGNQVTPDGTADQLQVFESTGDRTIQLRASGDDPVNYVVDVGLSSADSGWLAVAQEEGSTVGAGELIALTTTECVATQEALDAQVEYVDDNDQRLVVAFTNGTDPDTATWTGPVEAVGTITSTSSATNGIVFDGAIDSGPDELIGRPFSVVVLGCDGG